MVPTHRLQGSGAQRFQLGLPEPATRPFEAKYRAILGPYLLHPRDIAGFFDPGTCAPIYLDWQSGEPSPRRDSILGSPIVLILTNFAVYIIPDIILYIITKSVRREGHR